jgi:hypothetical protein
MPHRLRRRATVATTALVCSAVVGTGPGARAASSDAELNLTFEDTALTSNSGSVGMDITVRSRNGGTIDGAAGVGGSRAAAFPAFKASRPPLAVLTVVDARGVDDLSPGQADFRFGADFRLDARSQGSSSDNGNNLIQRGLFGAAMQYKIQVDGNRPLCRLKGTGGVVQVRSSRKVPSNAWYRATCIRRGQDVMLRVVRLDDGRKWTYRASGRTGSLVPSSSSVPLSVGGKVHDNGQIMGKSADQFNGRIDNAFLEVS